MKYIIYGSMGTYVTFPNYIGHEEMEHKLGVTATGGAFCKPVGDKMVCFGKSQSLGFKAKEDDNEILNLEEL